MTLLYVSNLLADRTVSARHLLDLHIQDIIDAGRESPEDIVRMLLTRLHDAETEASEITWCRVCGEPL